MKLIDALMLQQQYIIQLYHASMTGKHALCPDLGRQPGASPNSGSRNPHALQ